MINFSIKNVFKKERKKQKNLKKTKKSNLQELITFKNKLNTCCLYIYIYMSIKNIK